MTTSEMLYTKNGLGSLLGSRVLKDGKSLIISGSSVESSLSAWFTSKIFCVLEYKCILVDKQQSIIELKEEGYLHKTKLLKNQN